MNDCPRRLFKKARGLSAGSETNSIVFSTGYGWLVEGLFAIVHKLVQNSHPFVALRGNTYYFRYVIPAHIRKLCPSLPTQAKRSLHTDFFSEAVNLVSHKLRSLRNWQAHLSTVDLPKPRLSATSRIERPASTTCCATSRRSSGEYVGLFRFVIFTPG